MWRLSENQSGLSKDGHQESGTTISLSRYASILVRNLPLLGAPLL